MGYILNEAWALLLYVANAAWGIFPVFLFSVALAVLLKELRLDRLIHKAFSRKVGPAVGAATAVGAFTPFCSCTVIPLINSMLVAGVPLAAVMAFWIASPTMDLEIFAVSVKILGWPLAIARLIATITLSLGAGYITYVLTRTKILKEEGILRSKASAAATSCCTPESPKPAMSKGRRQLSVLAHPLPTNVNATVALADAACCSAPVLVSANVASSQHSSELFSSKLLAQSNTSCGCSTPVVVQEEANSSCGCSATLVSVPEVLPMQEEVNSGCGCSATLVSTPVVLQEENCSGCGCSTTLVSTPVILREETNSRCGCSATLVSVPEALPKQEEASSGCGCSAALVSTPVVLQEETSSGCGCSATLVSTPIDVSEPWWSPLLANAKAINWREFTSAVLKQFWMLGCWMLLAFFIEAALVRYVPTGVITGIFGSHNPFAIPLAALLGIPVYVNYASSWPIVSGLLAQGMRPGAAIAFLLAGPITTFPAMMAVWNIVHRRVFFLYFGMGVVGAILIGFVVSLILP